MRFLGYCTKNSKEINIDYFAQSAEGKDIPLAIFSKNGIPDQKKLKVLVVTGIHSGEVDGKEAGFVLVREILFGKLNYLLNKCTIYFVPTLNVDGNDKINRYNRLSQNGPYNGVGLSDFPNGMNINRDFSKHELPETEALIKNVINKYDPQIIIDCHTTNGSYHAYALTYAPPLNPNTNKLITDFLRKELFPVITKNLYEKSKYRTQYYGNFVNSKKPEEGWETFNYRPRYSNNYFGLINRIGILSEGYSYLELRKRIDVTFKFVSEILEYAYNHTNKIKNIINKADAENCSRLRFAKNEIIALKCETYEEKKPIGIYLGAVDSVKDPAGKGYTFKKKEDYEKLVLVKDYTNFKSSLSVKMPFGYIIPAEFKKIARNMLAHGITVKILSGSVKLMGEVFLIDSVQYSMSKFQAHYPAAIYGKYEKNLQVFKTGDYFIPMMQVKSNLIPQLLEPLCEDGYAYWNFFDDFFKLNYKNRTIQYPVFRILTPVELKCTLLK